MVAYSEDEVVQIKPPVVALDISTLLGSFGPGDYGGSFVIVARPFIQILGFPVELDGEVLIQGLDDCGCGGQFVSDSVSDTAPEVTLVQPEITPPPAVSRDFLGGG
jgi:hypothetical protein